MQELEKLFNDFRTQNETAWQAAANNCNAAEAKAEKFYKSKMKSLFEAPYRLFSSEELHQMHGNTKERAITKFLEHPNTGDSSMIEPALDRLEQVY